MITFVYGPAEDPFSFYSVHDSSWSKSSDYHDKCVLQQKRKMSDENSELDEIDFNSELESAETISNASGSPLRVQDVSVSRTEPTFSSNFNIVQNLFRREVRIPFVPRLYLVSQQRV